jgi:hypothetical protein
MKDQKIKFDFDLRPSIGMDPASSTDGIDLSNAAR